MSLGEFAIGIVFLAITVGSLVVGAVALRRVLFAGWTGAPARLVECIVTVCALSAVAQLVGIVGLFNRWAIALGCVVVGALLFRAASRLPRNSLAGAGADDTPPASRLTIVAASIAVIVLTGQWLARSIDALRHGMYMSVDTLWYHGPMAARWVQDGSIIAVHYFDGEPLTAFYPAAGDLFHGVGIALMGDDVLSPIINIGWLMLAFLAAWCIGRNRGVGPACVMALAVTLSMPLMLETQPAAMYTDIVGYALIFSAVALLINRERAKAAFWLAGFAAGIALGVKYTMIIPVGVLTLGVFIMSRGARLRSSAIWAGLLTLGGGLWYVRNVVVVLNPLPPLDLHLGALSPPSPPILTPSLRVIDYITDSHIVNSVYLPGLRESFGRTWWMIVALAVLGGVGALISARQPITRVLGAMALVAIFGFLVTPQALGAPGDPFFFAVVLRYVALPLALGLVALALVPALTTDARRWWLPAVLAVVFVATEIDHKAWIGNRGVLIGSVIAVAGLGLVVLLLRTHPPTPRGLTIVVTALGMAGIIAFGAVQSGYQQNRYKGYRFLRSQWAATVKDARIGIIGPILQYPFYGADLSNHVQWISRIGRHGVETAYTTCGSWRRAVNEGDYDYVVVTRYGYPIGENPSDPPAELEWTRSDPGVSVVHRDGDAAVAFRIDQPLDPSSCPSSGSGSS